MVGPQLSRETKRKLTVVHLNVYLFSVFSQFDLTDTFKICIIIMRINLNKSEK